MTKITTRFAPQFISTFLRTATKGQISFFLSKGEPQCLQGQFLVEGEFVEKLFPGLRGVIVGKAVETPEEAIAKAAEVLKETLTHELEPFDEEAAGLGTEAIDLQDEFEENLLRIEEIAHIGTMQDGSLSEPLERMIENLEDMSEGPHTSDLAFLKEAIEDGESAEGIVQMMRDQGTVGFLIAVSVPAQTPTGKTGASIHYGTRHVQVIYGQTFGLACKKAVEWAKEKNASFRKEAA